MMSVCSAPSEKGKLEGYMNQFIEVGDGMTSKDIFPTKRLIVVKGEYDWQYLRKGDQLALHRQSSNQYDEIEEMISSQGLTIRYQ